MPRSPAHLWASSPVASRILCSNLSIFLPCSGADHFCRTVIMSCRTHWNREGLSEFGILRTSLVHEDLFYEQNQAEYYARLDPNSIMS